VHQAGQNNGGMLKYASIKVEFVNTSTNPEEVIPANIALKGNYPNPFNPETTIQYSVNNPANVKIEVYNTKGQKVRTLVDEHKNAGEYNVVWQGKNEAGNSVASGVYFYRLTSNNETEAKKMLLIK
ncbi:MAG: T9SS type A sorting domain-containing protein, partial [Candidatus Cloacimonadota bacterium]|nr:T9SS type A sorting domain-containing protein [Candidatus Cloacimonadota bacterium]